MAWKNFSRSRQRNDFFFFLFSFRTQLLSWNFSPQLLSIKIDSQTSPPFSSFLFQPSLPALFSKGIYPSTRTLVNYFLDKLIRSAKLSFILQDPFRKKEREREEEKKKENLACRYIGYKLGRKEGRGGSRFIVRLVRPERVNGISRRLCRIEVSSSIPRSNFSSSVGAPRKSPLARGQLLPNARRELDEKRLTIKRGRLY